MDSATVTPPNGTEYRAIVDTHRHPMGTKMQAKMAEAGLYDPKQGYPMISLNVIEDVISAPAKPAECQRRRENASASRSKNASWAQVVSGHAKLSFPV
jgi:hypothetical protein